MPGRGRGRRAAWLAVAAAGGLLAGCASATTPQAGSTPAAGEATRPAQGQGGTAPASPAGTGAAAPGLGGLALCQPSSLHVTVSTSQTGVAMGSSYYPVDFTNTASSACGLYGYPGASRGVQLLTVMPVRPGQGVQGRTP